MPAAPKPTNEQERLQALSSFAILDTPPDQAFDDLVEVASYICETPLAAVSLVDTDRQWFKARVGVDAEETSRDVSFCGHAILHEELFEVPNALEDIRFADSPLVTGEMGLRFYAGVPLITSDNFALGTLCVYDREPRELTAAQREALRALSRQAVALLERHKAMQRIQELAKQKEEFLRVASHDLKSPLQAIFGAADLFELYADEERISPRLRECVTIITERAEAMRGIIQDFVDGHAIEDGQLQLHPERVDLAGLAQRVIGGHMLAAQAKRITIALDSPSKVEAQMDPARIAQVLENLVGNAVKFSPQGSAVAVRVATAAGRIRVEVVDAGPGLTDEDMAQVFTRYGRLSAQPTAGEASTGLGLAIARQLIEAHGGVIGARNNADRGATFWFEVPG